jgi:hypothetical protein
LTYILYAIVSTLVVGWKNWGPVEYTGIAGAPVVLLLIRRGIAAYYNYRAGIVKRRLEEYQSEKTKTIDKLKAATKYNSTQELLEKYGGAPKQKRQPSETRQKIQGSNTLPRRGKAPAGRTGIIPPPTANIPRSNSVSLPNPPNLQQSPPPHFEHPLQQAFQPPHQQQLAMAPQASFAPNAYPSTPAYDRSQQPDGQHHWYDRIFDVILGDDETAPKNRIVLICSNCRLVNGQAPPGVKTLREIGEWRCMQCGATNGHEEKKEIREMIEKVKGVQKTDEGHASGSDREDKADTSLMDTTEEFAPNAEGDEDD